jgi:hypothetical protein
LESGATVCVDFQLSLEKVIGESRILLCKVGAYRYIQGTDKISVFVFGAARFS